MSPAVEVRHLSKRFRRGRFGVASLRDELEGLFARARGDQARSDQLFYALDDVSFSVAKGSICGLLGPNGSGKTTLMKILASITEPTAGEAILRGRVGSLLEVSAGFDEELDGIENIFLNGAILGMSRAEIRRKLDDIIRFADVGPVLETPVKRYSSGMYVRLAFAIAAHLDAEILLVDEVLAVGDADFQRKCLATMRDVAAQGRTVFFVSHNMAAVRQLCDSAIYLEGGRLIQAGPLAPVLESYLSRYAEDVGPSVFPDGLAAEVQFLGADQEPCTHLRFGAAYDVALRLSSPRPLRNLSARLEIFNEDGVLTSSLDTGCEGLAAFDVHGAAEVRFPIPSLALAPGSYRIGLLVFRPEDEGPYVRTDALRGFDVTAAMVAGASHAYAREHGAFRLANGAFLRRVG